ncbi:MAG: hypothetical protein ACE5EX_05470 [Phycisphaerae bacterium]
MYRVRIPSLLAVACGAAVAAGCLAPARSNYRTTEEIAVGADIEAQRRLWETVETTLRRHRFRLDRVDRRAGVITTYPETSQHFFEFWRHDVQTRRDFWEATLNPIRRWVEVRLTPEEGGGGMTLAVVVHKERFSAPDRQFNNTAAIYEFFGYNLPSTTGLASITPEHERWIDVGRDPALEAYLLQQILDAQKTRPTRAAPTMRE